MRQPVTIGDQKFVWSDDKKAWIDEKTKVLANQGMQSLLEVAQTGKFHPDQKDESTTAPPIVKPDPPELDKKKEEKEAETKPYNNEPVSIGGQKFIIDPIKGWVDAKTKQPAQKELVKLLEQITGVKVEGKKLGTDKIEIEPIIIGDQKYIWDPKKQYWIDAKTKQKADDALQKLLTSTINKAGMSKFEDVDFGAVGAAATEKIKKTEAADKPKKKTGTEAVPQSKKAKNLLVTMIGKLKSIDSSFRARSDIISKQNAKEYAEARELAVENAQRTEDLTAPDATREGGSALGKGLGIAAIIGIVALAFDPVKKSLQTAYDYIKGAYDSTTWLYKTLTDGFNSLLGLGKTAESSAPPEKAPPAKTSDATPTPPTRAQAPAKASVESTPAKTISPPITTSEPTRQTNTNRVEASAPTTRMQKPVAANENRPRRGWYKTKGPKNPVADAKSIVEKMFPQARITSSRRKAGKAGKAGSSSWHVKSGAAVDIAPIPGMSFDTWLNHFRRAGYTIIEAIDETIPANRKITGGSGPHWHVVLGGGGSPRRVDPTKPNAGETYQEPDNSTDYVGEAMEAEDPIDAMVSLVKGFTQMLRVIGKTDSYYLGDLEEMTSKKTNRIGEITAQKYADMVDKNRDISEDYARMNTLELPNINQKGGGTVQTPSTSFDKKIVEQYLRYFGFNPKSINL